MSVNVDAALCRYAEFLFRQTPPEHTPDWFDTDYCHLYRLDHNSGFGVKHLVMLRVITTR